MENILKAEAKEPSDGLAGYRKVREGERHTQLVTPLTNGTPRAGEGLTGGNEGKKSLSKPDQCVMCLVSRGSNTFMTKLRVDW